VLELYDGDGDEENLERGLVDEDEVGEDGEYKDWNGSAREEVVEAGEGSGEGTRVGVRGMRESKALCLDCRDVLSW